MPYLGSRTVADCKSLAQALHPKLLGLRAAYAKLRPQWEAHDLFGAQRYAGDLARLEGRWGAAVEGARRVRVCDGQEGVTVAGRQFDRMVRAVRQGGMTGAPRGDDLAGMSVRLRRAGRKLGVRFGYDVLAPFDSALTASGSVKSIADCAGIIAQYGDTIGAMGNVWQQARSAWGLTGAATADAIYNGPLGKLQSDWASAVTGVALKAGDPGMVSLGPSGMSKLLMSDSGNASNPAQDEYDALMAAVTELSGVMQLLARGQQMFGGGSTVGFGDDSGDSTFTTNPSGATVPANSGQPLQDKDSKVNEELGKMGQATNPFLPVSTDTPPSGNGTSTPSLWDRVFGTNPTIPSALNPLDSPWVKGALVVGGIGVLGYTLSQIKGLWGFSRAMEKVEGAGG